MSFMGCEPKKMKKIARRADPPVYRALHHIKLAHILRPFQVKGQLLEKHSWTEKKRSTVGQPWKQIVLHERGGSPRKRALFGVICPTWRRILGKAEESSWVMFKAHLRDLAQGGINFAWAGWHDEAFRCCVICLPFFEIRHLAQSLCLWEGTWVSGMVAIRETCTGSSMWGRHLSICRTGWDLASADLWTGNKEGDIRAARSVTRVLSSGAQVKTSGDILSWTT